MWSIKSATQHARCAQTICTDASDSGWGASTGITTIAGTWSERQKATSINWRELKTSIIAINAWNFVRNTPLLVLTDSSTVVAAIQKRASKAQALQYLIKDLLNLEKHRGIEVVAIHLSGNLNDLPDRLSRGLPIGEASMLTFNRESFPVELRNFSQLHGLAWKQSRWDSCPFLRQQELKVVSCPLLIAITTPDLPFLKLHLKKLAELSAEILILLPLVPSSELPLPFTRERKIESSPFCYEAENSQWTIVEVLHIGGINAKTAE